MLRSLAALAALAAYVALPVPAAVAGPSGGVCTDRTGVTVVVEPAALGGAAEVRCVRPAPGDTGADLFQKAGHRFTRVTSMPDVVCRIDNRPADAGCGQMPPADAYWSLWVADNHGTWTYGSRNVNEITVTSGGGVAFRWVDGNVTRAPATVLADAVGAPASPSPVSSPSSSADSDRHAPAALPGWVAPSVVLILGAAAVVVWRRRS